MNNFVINKISRTEFLKLNEDNVMFITNPGRMGDEDGSTFIIKNNNEFRIYRVDGWMYPNKNEKKEYKISMEETAKQFPKWYKTWENSDKKDYKGKYIYLYMGFGNGLSIDKSIYNIFKNYLNELVKEYLENKKGEDKESYKYAAVFDVWEKAFINMINDKNYILK